MGVQKSLLGGDYIRLFSGRGKNLLNKIFSGGGTQKLFSLSKKSGPFFGRPWGQIFGNILKRTRRLAGEKFFGRVRFLGPKFPLKFRPGGPKNFRGWVEFFLGGDGLLEAQGGGPPICMYGQPAEEVKAANLPKFRGVSPPTNLLPS